MALNVKSLNDQQLEFWIAEYTSRIPGDRADVDNAKRQVREQQEVISQMVFNHAVATNLTPAQEQEYQDDLAQAKALLGLLQDHLKDQQKLLDSATNGLAEVRAEIAYRANPVKETQRVQTEALDSTPKPVSTPVKSGSGQPSTSSSVNGEAVAAGDFAYGDLGSGTAGGMGNAALLSTTTILPNTKRTNVSKAEMEAADKNYTTEMNKLSQHWSVGDTSSPEYEEQKQAAMKSQYEWELARNNLEEVAGEERAALSEAPISTTGLDEELQRPELPSLEPLPGVEPATESPPQDEIIVTAGKNDDRLRIYAKSADYPLLYTGVMAKLQETNGVVFPYTPTITHQHRAEYNKISPTHSNTDYYTYVNSPAVSIQIQGQFTAQNLAEAQYMLACIHFFRTVTKMHFGNRDPSPGLPPPVLNLKGYGEFMFNKLNVIVTDFSMDLPGDVDYVKVDIDGYVGWVPALTTFNVTCVVQNTPAQQRDDFSLTDFANGTLLDQGGFI
jgi:hypothetical protein